MHRKDKFFFEHGLTRLNRWLQNSKNEVITCYPTLQIARTVGSSRGPTAAVVCNTTLLYLFFFLFWPGGKLWADRLTVPLRPRSSRMFRHLLTAVRLGEKKTRTCCSRWLLGLGSIYNLNSENFMLGLRVDSTLSKSPSLNKYHRWCACGKFNSICKKYMQY